MDKSNSVDKGERHEVGGFRDKNYKAIAQYIASIEELLVELRVLLVLMEKEGQDTPPPSRNRSAGIPEAPGGPE